MSRNHYEPEFGVCPLEWHAGEPTPNAWPVLVEVWRSSLFGIDTTYNTPTRPAVRVEARLEVRVHFAGEWKVIGYAGALTAPRPGEVRRHARFTMRSWSKTITLDGWDSL